MKGSSSLNILSCSDESGDPVAGLGLVSNTRKKVCDSPWPSRATGLGIPVLGC